MSDRSLRGMRLGTQSMETESNVQPAPRQRVEYRTTDGDRVFVLLKLKFHRSGLLKLVKKHIWSTARVTPRMTMISQLVHTGTC